MIYHGDLTQIDIDEEGKQSLMRLAQGDMRKVLNILQVQKKHNRSCLITNTFFFQSCNMAFGKVTEDNVYTCVGQYSFEIYHIALAFVHLAVHLCICESIQLNLPLKGSNPHRVQGTPFALTLQTSPIGLLMKTSQQPTSNVLLNHYQCSFGQRLNWFLFQPSEQAENSEGFEPAGYPSRGSPLRAQA